MYRWKDTIGPIHERREQENLWGYHQSVGLGYFEFFQFCEDIGAKPLPIVPAAVSCQHSGQTSSTGQEGLPMDQMAEYVQEVLDLVEWANGPATSEWGAKRAAAGHPEPFGLEYLGVGNEDAQTPAFRERFAMIYSVVKAKHPEITVIGTVGPFPDGEDFEAGWQFADRLAVKMVDEHYYRPPQWFLEHTARYDTYDRSNSLVYVGEYAAHDRDRRTTLRAALAEAAFMTGLERNGDVVRLTSYAPLLGKLGHCQWNPNLIYFSNTEVFPTVSFYVQQMFGANQGDRYLPATLTVTPQPAEGECVAASTVVDSTTGDVIIKLVNASSTPRLAQIELRGGVAFQSEATRIVLAGELNDSNSAEHPDRVVPAVSQFTAGKSFVYEAAPHSFTVLRLKTAAQ